MYEYLSESRYGVNKIELSCRPAGKEKIDAHMWTDQDPSRAIFAALNGICSLNYNEEDRIVPWTSTALPDLAEERRCPDAIVFRNEVLIDKILINATDLGADVLAKTYSDQVAETFYRELKKKIDEERAKCGRAENGENI